MMQELRIVKERIRTGLEEHGTNVGANERDLLGDGDQSTIYSQAHRQFYRDIFSEGGDLAESFGAGTMSDFAVRCIQGSVQGVEEMLEVVSSNDLPHPSDALIKLLETRETSMRLTPLLLLVSAGKNISGAGPESVLRRNQIQVAELLLRYGARPDAKDVCGKTACHYGAGAMATKTTMVIVEKASQACKTSHMFNQEVELTGLKDSAKNGLRGIARGFNCSNGRRVVHLCDEGTELAIKPENIKLVTGDPTNNNGSERKLCDLQCRLGTVSLLETTPANRGDVAEFLINTLGASIDIEDLDGVSGRSMAMVGGAEMVSPAATVIKHAAGRQGKASNRSDRRKCANCSKPEPRDKKFEICSRCKQVRYCQKNCQGMFVS
jgi:hypothetical protein